MQLVFGVAGAYVGSFFGMPGLGFTVGSFIGGAIAGQDDLPIQEGPRSSDLKSPQTAQPGIMVTIAFGTIRLPVEMIWGPDKVEHEVVTTVDSGGKGSPPEQEQRTFYYTADAAYGVCEGPIVGAGKWWANSKLVSDASADSPITSRLGGMAALIAELAAAATPSGFFDTITLYRGTETQLQDPTIAAQEGATVTPAYRGTAYFVFNDLNLTPYFNNHPMVEVEVVCNGARAIMVPEEFYTLPGGLAYAGAGGGSEQTWLRRNSPGAKHYWVVLPDGSGNPRVIGLFDNYAGGSLILQRTEGANLRLLSTNGLNGRMWYEEQSAGTRAISTSGQVWEFDPAGGDYIEELYEFPDLSDDVEVQEESPKVFIERVNSGVGSISIFWGNALLMASLSSVVTGRGINRFLDSADRIAGRIYIKSTNFGGGFSRLGYCETQDVNSTYHVVRDYSDGGEPSGMVGRDGYLYVRSGMAGFFNKIEKMDPDGTVVDSITLPGIATTNNDPIVMVQDSFGLLYVQVDQIIFRINYGTMELVDQATLVHGDDWIMPSDAFEGRGILVSRSEVGYFDKLYILGDPITPAAPPLSDVTATILEKDGYSASEYNVSLLTGIPVRGYAIRRRMSGRNMLAPLFDANFVDMVESDGKLKFVPRGSASIVTIPEADLGAHTGDRDDPVETLRITRREELDYRNPVEVTVLYIRKESDYQQGMQNSRRLTTPSKHAITIDYPIVLTDDEAKQIADKKAFGMQYERETYEFSTGRKYCWYEPTDVVTVVKGGTPYVMRLVDKKEGGNGVIEWVGVQDLSSLYSQISIGVVPSVGAQVIELIGPTEVEFLDIPLVRDQDDNAGFLLAARGVAGGFRGTQLYQSPDSGVTYSPVNGIATAATIGYTLNVLGPYDRNEIIDEGNYVDVQMRSGLTVASITREELLDGGNACVIGGEPLHFRDADLIATDTYRLTGFLRGRRGSETFMSSHVAGERFVMLDASLRSISDTVAHIGQPTYYKAVSLGRTLAQSNPIVFTNTARRKKPLAPVQLGAGKDNSGNWTLTCRRRTRYEAVTIENGDVPLGEGTEAYTWHILDGSTIVRTLSSTVPTVQYSSADQLTDWGLIKSGLDFEVAQVSTEVGEGYYAEARGLGTIQPGRYWQIDLISLPSGTVLELSEVRLFASGVDVTSLATYTGDEPDSAGAGFTNWKDNDLNTREYWLVVTGKKLKIDFGPSNQRVIDGIKLGGWDDANRYPTGFTLSYSDDDVTYTPFGTKSGLTYPGDHTLSAMITFP